MQCSWRSRGPRFRMDTNNILNHPCRGSQVTADNYHWSATNEERGMVREFIFDVMQASKECTRQCGPKDYY